MEIYQKRNISTDNNILGAVGKHGPSSIQRLCRNVVSPKMHSTAPGSYPNIPCSRIICPHEQLTIGIDRAVPKSAQPGCFPVLVSDDGTDIFHFKSAVLERGVHIFRRKTSVFRHHGNQPPFRFHLRGKFETASFIYGFKLIAGFRAALIQDNPVRIFPFGNKRTTLETDIKMRDNLTRIGMFYKETISLPLEDQSKSFGYTLSPRIY